MTDNTVSEFDIIKNNYRLIIDAITGAAKDVGRNIDEAELVAVSKVQSRKRIQAGLDLGLVIFGENRVQEAQKRWAEDFADYRDRIQLHLIGPLQTNKAEDAAVLFDVIETMDREKLLKALAKAADKTGRRPRLYVQVNTGEEPQKSGLLPKDVENFTTKMRREYHWEPEGFMCIPPQG